MCAGFNHYKRQLIVILIPHQEPIRLNVTLPRSMKLSRKSVRAILRRNSAAFNKDIDYFSQLLYIKTSFIATFQSLLKLI